jgi:glycosyltransferase involved in cell wall biosynthesis
MKLSVVSAVYNEQECLPELCQQLIESLESITEDFEVVLVDDGSRDRSWEIICNQGAQHRKIRGLRFSRNFGHHYAITAGLDYSVGDWVVVMDSDLQDSPAAIPALLAKACEGYDVVLAVRKHRQFGWFKIMCSKMFYRVFRYVSGSRYDGATGLFRIMSRQVVDALHDLPEVDRFFPALVDWVGFRQSSIDVIHGKRFAGETKYPLRKQIALAVNAILSFSEKPIEIIVYVGLVVVVLSTIYASYICMRALFGSFTMLGYASIVTVVSFFGGMTIATLGIIGLYIGRIFRQVKSRPTYIVAESVNNPEAALGSVPSTIRRRT